jgi:hypothetical protein
MMRLLRDALRSLRAWPVFGFYTLLALGVAAYIGGVVFLMNAAPDVLPGALAQMSHFGDQLHRIHDLAYGFIFTIGVVGVAAQLRRPETNVAGMAMALVPWAALLLAALLSDSYAGMVERNPWYPLAVVTLIALLVHPAGRGFVRSFGVSRINWTMLALVGLAAVPLLSFASTNLRLQETVTDQHAGMGHYGFMAAFSYTVLGVGALASLRPDGWRLTAWAAGLLPALLGVSSLLYADLSSSLDRGWALMAIVWGAAFVAAAVLTDTADSRTNPAGSPGAPAEANT